MSEFSREELGKRILDLRVRKKMSQEELAERVSTTRTTVSKWESGNSEPSALQLKAIATVFGVSIDYLCGNTEVVGEKICVLDTCVVLERPRLIDQLIKEKDKLYSKIIIPDVVSQELNYQKDRGKGSLGQKAWLAMATIDNNKEALIFESSEYRENEVNDDRIMQIAKKYALDNANNKVAILTNDVYFSLKNETFGLRNLTITSVKEIEAKLYANEDFDEYNTQNFISAIKTKKIDEVKKAYNRTVDVNRIDSQTGHSPLIIAIRNKSHDILEYLLSLDGVDVDRRDKTKYEFTPLLHCCQIRDLESMQLLIKYGASVNSSSRGRNTGNTPLMVCAWSQPSFDNGLKLLMENEQISYNQQDSNGFTALHKACIRNNYKVIELLIDHIDKNIEDFQNKKAVEYLQIEKNSPYYEKIRKLFQK